ncbi:MAG: hypothetical protein R3254_00490 [Thiomicrorhabdus sp.]|nr:hypothetical protein [Thiomicrorhabdus sp.]
MKKKSGLLLLLSWLAGLVGLVLGLTLEPLWFARFGSVVVLFAVMSEYSLLHGELKILYDSLEANVTIKEIDDITPSRWHQKKVHLTHITLITGTLIWGFGDLLL